MDIQTPQSTSDEVKKVHLPARLLQLQHKENLSPLEKLAVFTTEKVGSMGFFLIIVSWTVIWLAWNTFAPATMRFDAFPGFILWLFMSNVIQLTLMPLIMVGQNIQGKHADTRSESDFEMNIKAQLEIERILHRLENQNESVMQKLQALEDRLNR